MLHINYFAHFPIKPPKDVICIDTISTAIPEPKPAARYYWQRRPEKIASFDSACGVWDLTNEEMNAQPEFVPDDFGVLVYVSVFEVAFIFTQRADDPGIFHYSKENIDA